MMEKDGIEGIACSCVCYIKVLVMLLYMSLVFFGCWEFELYIFSYAGKERISQLSKQFFLSQHE